MVDPDSPNQVHRLTSAIAAGDTQAFAEFYEDRFDRLYRHARAITGRDEAFCLDVVQDAMLKVVRSMRAHESDRELSAWLRRVVRSAAVDRIRAEQRRERRERGREREPQGGCDAGGADRREWLARELASLDGSVASLLVERFGFGWTLRRIAAATGATTGAVDGRINRAVARLRRKAKEQFDD